MQPESASFESRWPTDGDRLFVESDITSDAALVKNPEERFYRLPMGYKRAGDILLNQAAADVVDRRNIIYAALYCYRHSVELFLKQLVERFGTPAKNTHDLMLLWEQFMVIATKHGAADSLGLSAMRELVAEMHNADKKSDGFRFPADRSDAPFPFADRGIDLENVLIVMQSIENFFECAYTDFEHREASQNTRTD